MSNSSRSRSQSRSRSSSSIPGPRSVPASQALAIARRNAKELRKIRPEIKYHDVSSTSTVALAGSATVIATCSIPQGDGPEDRDGAEVCLKSFNVRGYFQKGAAASQSTFVRMLVVQAMTDDTPTSSTVFRGTPYVTSFRNMDHTSDFRVLLDKVYRLDEGDDEGVYFKINLNKFPYDKVKWDRTDTTGAAAKKGKLYILLCSEEATNPASYQVQIRLRYTDN